ncbi:MAG: alpha/beta hydrolase [Elainellaceae cyanobacterium]
MRVSSSPLEMVIQINRSLAEKVMPLLSINNGAAIEQLRLLFFQAFTALPVAEDITIHPVSAAGVPAEWVTAPNSAESRVMLYLHGGGYVVCSPDTHRNLVARLARAAGVRALSLDYRLAPEHPFPSAVHDAIAAYRWLIATGVSPEQVVLAGDSAGGGLVLATLVALRDAGDQLPAAAVCLSPWVDLEARGESMITNAEADPFVNKKFIQFLAQQYAGTHSLRHPLAAPLYADLHGLPPLLIQVGAAETLLDDAVRIAKRAKHSGVDVTLEIWQDMIHVWQLSAPILPEAQQAIDQVGEFVRSVLERQSNPLSLIA